LLLCCVCNICVYVCYVCMYAWSAERRIKLCISVIYIYVCRSRIPAARSSSRAAAAKGDTDIFIKDDPAATVSL